MFCKSLEEIQERILRACERSGRKREEVTLLGASKGVSWEVISTFYECGLKTFGENRVQEFLKKYDNLKDRNIDWHFIGRLQTNKVKYIIDKVSLIHSLDRESLADEINRSAKRKEKVQKVLVEINFEEETKGGVKPENLKALYEYTLNLENLQVTGLMCIPPYRKDPEDVRPYFREMAKLKRELEYEYRVTLPELSMGMSSDFEVAIEEGATIVRIGTALFAP